MDNDKPAYVALSFEEYERLSNGQEQMFFPERKKLFAEPAEENILEEVNQEIFNLQGTKEDDVEDIVLEESEAIPMGPASEPQEIRIEDIPLL